MALLAIIYWWGASAYLSTARCWTLPVPAAVAISAASLVVGWLIYDALCRSGRSNELALGVVLYLLIVAAAWGYGQVFGARAAFIHVGALIGTIMVWNVFFHIIPGQQRMVRGDPGRARAGPALRASSASSAACTTPTSRCRCCSS